MNSLGPAETLIVDSAEKVRALRQWAINNKHVPENMVPHWTVPQLVNLYHERSQATTPAEPNEAQRLAAEITAQVLAVVGKKSIDADTVRAIVREMGPAAERRIDVVIPGKPTTQIPGNVHYATEQVLRIVALGHPTMLVGPAGCGKTTIGEHVAKALNLTLYITSAITDSHELTGFIDGHGTYHRTPFRDAFEHGGVWIADEIDSWDAAALLTANAALANGYAVFPDAPRPIKRHDDFRMIATANTYGSGADRVYVGRNELDAASLDRFATINIDYDKELERQFAGNQRDWLAYVWRIREAVQQKRIRHVVSSRAIIMGAMALNAGIPLRDVKTIYLFKGMSEADKAKVDNK